MKKIFLIALVLVLSNINHSTAIAQEEEKKSNLFLIHEDVVKPSMVSQYMETSKEFVKLMEDENADVPPFWASMTSDLYFYYLTPLENYSALDKDNEKWGAAIEKMGQEKFDAVMDKYKGTYLHHRNFLMRRSNMYSYKPENPRLKDDEIKFLRWGFYYLEEGNEEMEIISIDDFVVEHDLSIGLIKMDLEGYEFEALKGAKNTIEKFKPVLLISIYHHPEELFGTKKYIQEMASRLWT